MTTVLATVGYAESWWIQIIKSLIIFIVGFSMVPVALMMDRKLLGRRSREEPLSRLSGREREVLELMAEGRSNSAIAQRLFVTEKAVSKHSTSIFSKLDLAPSDDDNRRVLAVLAYLNG